MNVLKDDPAAPEISCKCGHAGCRICDTYDYSATIKRAAMAADRWNPGCSGCGHVKAVHSRSWGSDTGCCLMSGCACTKYRAVDEDLKEAEQFYAELKARLDERAPA